MSEIQRPTGKDDWKEGRCAKCGHEWLCRLGATWVCARCEWPPRSLTETSKALRGRLLQWIEIEMARRSGNGSYAKGQRMILQQLRRQLEAWEGA